MANRAVTGKLITNDGEVITDLYEGDKVVRGKTIEFLEQTQEWKIEHFYKGHIDEITKLNQELNVYEKAFIYSVVPYVGYNDCLLKYNNTADGNPLTFDDMVKITGISRGKLHQTLDDLIKKDIIYKGRNSVGLQYFINPWLFCKGQRINKVLKAMFQNYRIRVMGGKKWGNIDDI